MLREVETDNENIMYELIIYKCKYFGITKIVLP